jgi:hypothetical protein
MVQRQWKAWRRWTMQWQQDSNGSNGQFDCAQMIAACVVLLVVNNNARGSDVGLVEFVKEYCI